MRQTKMRPLIVPVAEPLKDPYERARARIFRQQIGVIVNIAITAILLHELLAFFVPNVAVPVPLAALFTALAAEILIWLVSRQITHLKVTQALTLLTFIVPLVLLVQLEALDVSYYLVVIFVVGFLLPWNGIEAFIVSLFPLFGFLFVRGLLDQIIGLASDLSVFFISTAIVTTIQLRQERERRTTFAIEADAERTRRDLMESLALAAKLHKDIISGSTDFSGLSARVMYESMQELGGDYVKMSGLGNGRYTMLVADVTGHGAPAALLVNRVDTKVQAIMGAKLPPDQAAEELNLFVTKTFEGTAMLMSAIWAEYDHRHRKVQWSNFGHPPPIYISRAERSIRILSSNAYVMGIDIPQQTPSSSIGIDPGDLILFYTDGLIEIRTAEGHFDLPALIDYLEGFLKGAGPSFHADDLLASLRETIDERRIGDVKDDLLLIAWEFKKG